LHALCYALLAQLPFFLQHSHFHTMLVPCYTLLAQLPFFLWQLAVLIVWAVTATLIEDMKGPIVSLALAVRVVYRFSHVRATAMALIVQVSVCVLVHVCVYV